MSTTIPSLLEIFKEAIENRLSDVNTAIIAKVEKYDAKTQQVDVSPVLSNSIKKADGSFVEEKMQMLCDVPVLFPRAGGFFLSFPIKVGDHVQILFNQNSLESWYCQDVASLAHLPKFTLQGAVAIPGLAPMSQSLNEAHEANLVIGKDHGVQIHIEDGQIRLGSKDASEALAIANAVKAELESFRTIFNTHVHSYHGTPTATQLGPIGNLATRKVVAE